MKLAIILATMLATTAAQADEWHGPDKNAHAVMGAVVGVAVTAYTKDWRWGCGAAWLAGIAHEVDDYYNVNKKGQATEKDAIVTGVAGCLAAGGTQLLIVPTDKGARFVWNVKF